MATPKDPPRKSSKSSKPSKATKPSKRHKLRDLKRKSVRMSVAARIFGGKVSSEGGTGKK